MATTIPQRDGTCVRDYIHVTDLASAHILAAEYLMNGGENNVFNLGNGVGFTVKEIIDTAEKVVGKPIKCEMAARRAGDPAQLVASSEKAKTVLAGSRSMTISRRSSVPRGTGTRSIRMAMKIETVWAALDSLLRYAKDCELLHPLDETFARNSLLAELKLESYENRKSTMSFRNV